MATLYVASTETFVGKSAVCLGLLDRARRDGFTAGYMKPVSVALTRDEDVVLDDDAVFIREHFGLADPLERIAPVLVTPGVIESILRGQQPDFSRRLRDAYVALSRNKDFVVLEGANHWAEGSIIDLSADQLTDMLQTPVLLIARYRGISALDTILAVQRYVGDRLLGVLLNQIEEPQFDFACSRVVPTALETSTSVLVLTGNVRPAAQVIDRAEEREVPIILVPDDTLTTVERAERIFGHIRFKQAAKIERFTALLDQKFDFARLYDELGMMAG